MDGQPDTARDYLDEALQIFKLLGEKYKIALINLDYARYFAAMNDKRNMVKSLDLVLDLLKELGIRFYIERVSKEIIDLLKSKGKMDLVERYQKMIKDKA
jgi:hypothetical protein